MTNKKEKGVVLETELVVKASAALSKQVEKELLAEDKAIASILNGENINDRDSYEEDTKDKVSTGQKEGNLSGSEGTKRAGCTRFNKQG